MREPYIAVNVVAQTETASAFCGSKLEFSLDRGIEEEIVTDLWIPKSVIHEESHDTIEEATRGDTIEIYVARWWLEKQI